MNSTTATAIPVPHSRPQLDGKPGIGTVLLFLALLAIGVVYTGISLRHDVVATSSHAVGFLPYFLLGVALLIALGFEFVNGFHDTANAVATVIYTHSLPPNFAVVWSGLFNFGRRAGVEWRRRLRHHLAAAGGADPAGGLERGLRDGVRAADRRHPVEPRAPGTWACRLRPRTR